jgi:glycosyltransferase involved in cell wall biosynthesis
MAPLRIGVNALYLIPGGVGGTEIYLRSLLAALGEIDAVNQYVVFTNRETSADLAPARPNFLAAPQAVSARNRPARLLWEQTMLPRAARQARLDVLFNAGFTAPAFCSCPSVTVFHDLQHKRHPEFFRWFDLPFWRIFLYAAAHRSRLLIADSDATRADLVRYYRLPEAKIRVIPLGADPVFFELQRGDRRNFLLYVSTLHPHKNQERLIRAFARFHRKHPEFRLILAGMRGFHAGAVDRQIAALGLEDAVQVTGWIPREELHKLYRDAFAFLYPSEFEGFGIPVLEALAAGIPTACSAIEPLASLALDAALQFDPADEGAILQAMERLTGDQELRQRLAREGPRRASEFTWRKTAEATLAAIREAAARSK